VKKILIVDDEPAIVRLLSYRLEYNQYKVLKAYDGYECLSMLENVIPDLVLMDIKMPKCDGIRTFTKMWSSEKFKNIPVLFMTSFAREYSSEHLTHMGAKGLLSKPIESKLFMESVDSIFT